MRLPKNYPKQAEKFNKINSHLFGTGSGNILQPFKIIEYFFTITPTFGVKMYPKLSKDNSPAGGAIIPQLSPLLHRAGSSPAHLQPTERNQGDYFGNADARWWWWEERGKAGTPGTDK